MANDNGDLFGDSSSSDADTDDLIAAAKSQPIATKKAGAAPKTKAASSSKKTPDADNDDDDDDDDNDSDFEGGKEETAGLFDSSSEDESGPKKKKLGKKRKAAAGGGKKKSAAGGKKKPTKKDTRSKKERMEALAKRRAGGDGSPEKSKEPRKKRSKSNNKEGGEAGGGGDGKEGGYQSGDSYGSENFQRTKEDDDFIDADDEDPDALKELYSEQHFEDERPDGYDSEEEEKAQKKKAASGSRKSSGGGGLDKISLSDDEEGGAPSATSALKEAVKRMRKTKKEAKKLPELEEEGVAFLKRMDAAADADNESIAARRPAMKKLAMLQDVMDMLARKDMVRVLLDLELLSVCKRWVQPLPNGSLGNVTLRRRIMESISTMTGENGVHASDLKQSGFGKVVMTLYMHKSETPEMKKMLKGIIEQWSRPIFQKSGNMRDLERAQAARGMSETGSLVGIARARAAETKMEERRKMGGDMKHGRNVGEVADIISGGPKSAGEVGSSRVRVPYSKGFQYSIRPESRRGDVSDKRNLVSAKGAAGPRADGDKREALGKRMIEKSRKTNKQNSRSANISIEGRVTK